MGLRPAIFFDRDGTLAEEVGYAGRPEDFHIYPFAAAAVRRANEAGWAAILVSNQAGVARGLFAVEAVEQLNQILSDHLAAAGAHLDGVYYCPHHPDFGDHRDCDCRKPKPGMLLRAARELGLDLSRSWVIGDKNIDVELAHRVGARGALVLTGYGAEERRQSQAELIAANALAAIEQVLVRPHP